MQTAVAKNNLFYCPGMGAKTLTTINDASADAGQVTKSNNTGDVGTATTDPKFSGVLTAIGGWQITDGTSYTKDVGASVPVWRDLFGTTRVTNFMDIGASEQGTVGNATLATVSWVIPTTKVDGSAIGTISAQTIHYDTVSRMGTGVDYAYSLDVGSISATTKTITNLTSGQTYYYATSVSIGGVRGEYGVEHSGVAA